MAGPPKALGATCGPSVLGLWGSRISAHAVPTEFCKIEARNLEYMQKTEDAGSNLKELKVDGVGLGNRWAEHLAVLLGQRQGLQVGLKYMKQ